MPTLYSEPKDIITVGRYIPIRSAPPSSIQTNSTLTADPGRYIPIRSALPSSIQTNADPVYPYKSVPRFSTSRFTTDNLSRTDDTKYNPEEHYAILKPEGKLLILNLYLILQMFDIQ